jgi:hypothetical protein
VSTFESSSFYANPTVSPAVLARELQQHFEAQGYQVAAQETLSRGWLVSLSKGDLFKAVLGMKTALNVELEPSGQGLAVRAKIGIFGTQIVPTMIGLFMFWPVFLVQIGGLVKQAKLDDEVLAVVDRVIARETASGLPATAPLTSTQRFCGACGGKLDSQARFCQLCGQKVD